MAALVSMALVALAVAGVGNQASAAGGGGGGGGGGGAAATVGNGLTTTDLGAVGMSPSSLASSLVGPGVTVSNVTYSGANAQAGTIHLADPAVVSFNDGVILSSGNIADVLGPNKSDGTTGDMAGPNDPQLDSLIADTQTVNPITFDAASLEFDFVPTSNQVYFTYTFGSDEYLEWVNLFNDVFAFYVNGQNCATVPGGSPVSIDTINSTVNPNLFRDNSFSSPPANPINIEPDGLSVEMICSAPVNAGQTNHMKLSIADTSDQILDSVVMVKAHSLSTTPPESCNDHVDNDDDTLVDDNDPSCQSTTTPPPVGSGGIGSSGSAPPFTGNEGTPIPLDASALDWTASGDTVSTSWTVTGINGTPGSCAISPAGRLPLNPDGTVAVVTATCPNEGEYVARVDGWDTEGGSSWDTDVDFFVHNAPPVVAIDAPASGSEAAVGDAVALSASVVDPGASDATTCDISWGDGSTESGVLEAGTCSGSHAYGEPGTKLISVTGTDDAGDSAAAASVITVGDAVASLTNVSSDQNPSVTGQPVTLTASTTVAAKGTMSFYDGATLLGTRSVSGGTAVLKATLRSAGDHGITASFIEAPGSVPSVSPVWHQQVDPAATTTVLSSTVNPSAIGQATTVRATVKAVAPGAGAAAGTVDLYDDDVYVATKAETSGVASFSLKPALGTHRYRAVYSGSADFAGSSTTTDLTQESVPAAGTSTTLSSTVSQAVSGQPVSIKATVKAAAPAGGPAIGTVDLYDDGAYVASRSVTNGVATFTLKPTLGTHHYTASYGGGLGYPGSTTTGSLDIGVDPAATTTTLTSSVDPSVVGQTVSLRATVKVVAPATGAAAGTVDLYDGDLLVASKVQVNGSATFSLKPTVGEHAYAARYHGPENLLDSSTAAPVHQTVLPVATTLALSTSASSTTLGHSGSLTAKVGVVAPGSGVPTGVVVFLDDGAVLATADLSSGRASVPLALLARGTHPITAMYVGADSYLPSASTSALVQVIT